MSSMKKVNRHLSTDLIPVMSDVTDIKQRCIKLPIILSWHGYKFLSVCLCLQRLKRVSEMGWDGMVWGWGREAELGVLIHCARKGQWDEDGGMFYCPASRVTNVINTASSLLS